MRTRLRLERDEIDHRLVFPFKTRQIVLLPIECDGCLVTVAPPPLAVGHTLCIDSQGVTRVNRKKGGILGERPFRHLKFCPPRGNPFIKFGDRPIVPERRVAHRITPEPLLGRSKKSPPAQETGILPRHQEGPP